MSATTAAAIRLPVHTGPLRYRIEPEEDTLHVYTWTQDLCFDLADHGEAQDFPLSEEGLEQIRQFIDDKSRSL